MSNIIKIKNKEGNLVVSSREIAKNFEKRHDNVLRDIENILETLENGDSSKLRNLGTLENGESSILSGLFIESKYQTGNSNGVDYKEYLLTRDGFTLLAMGFTGNRALEWKLKYIEAFNKMEQALEEVYHVSETAIVNNVMNSLENKFFPEIDRRLKQYEENYRPTHANKIDINNYIKRGLGELREDGEVELVKDRVLLILDGQQWQDIPYERIKDNFHIVDESIRAVKSFRTKSQLSMFEN